MRFALANISVVCGLMVSLATAANAIHLRHDLEKSLGFADATEFRGVFPLHIADNGARKICAATLIRQRWAITAAHCIDAIAGRLVKGQSASVNHKVQIGGRENTVDSVFVHPNWQGAGTYDVALIRLTWPEKRIAPIPLYLDPLRPGMTITIMGWGAHGNGRDGELGNDGRLRTAENRIHNSQVAWFTIDFSDPVLRPIASLKHEGIGGSGDSGGPALFSVQGEWHIAGVRATQSTPAAGPGRYGTIEAYVPTQTIEDWIERIAK